MLLQKYLCKESRKTWREREKGKEGGREERRKGGRFVCILKLKLMGKK